jgi:hypothetical protein
MPVGQVQKEDFVNEALLMLDGLLHCGVENQSNVPPLAPADGQAWLIGTAASGAWTGHEGKIALHQLGQWLFIVPRDGMQILNKATGQRHSRIAGAWQAPSAPAAPVGGTVIDAECRAALAAVLSALRLASVLPT